MKASGKCLNAAYGNFLKHFPGGLLDELILQVLLGGTGAEPQDVGDLSGLQPEPAKLQRSDGFACALFHEQGAHLDLFQFFYRILLVVQELVCQMHNQSLSARSSRMAPEDSSILCRLLISSVGFGGAGDTRGALSRVNL